MEIKYLRKKVKKALSLLKEYDDIASLVRATNKFAKTQDTPIPESVLIVNAKKRAGTIIKELEIIIK